MKKNVHKRPYSHRVLGYGLFAMLVIYVWIPIQINSQDKNHRLSGPVSYDSIYKLVLEMEEQEQYEAARELLLGNATDFPAHCYDISRELIYLNKKTDRLSENIDIFRKGHEKGYFYFLNTHLPSCKPYLEMESFEELAIRDQELRQAAIAISQSEYEIVPPSSYDPDKSYPAIFILHGGGSNLIRAQKHWNSVDLKRNFILVFIQSYLHYDYNTFGWKRYDPRARQDIKNCFSEVLDDYKILSEEVAIAGISAGATMALDVFLNNIIPVKACIVFSPSRPTEFLSENMLSEEFENKTAVMLIGENDSEKRKSDFIEMAEAMSQAGIHTPVTIMPDTGHEYPIDFPSWIRSSLEIIYPEKISKQHESSSHH